jgi:predicted dehydrogenase
LEFSALEKACLFPSFVVREGRKNARTRARSACVQLAYDEPASESLPMIPGVGSAGVMPACKATAVEKVSARTVGFDGRGLVRWGEAMSGDRTMDAPTRRSDPVAPPRRSAASRPLRVAAIGMGWWSDVLADAVVRSGKLEIAACFTRSADKRRVFAAKYRCRAAASYEEILGDREIEAIINTTPNDAHLETTRAAAQAGKHVFLDKPIANTVAQARAITAACRDAGVVLALGYQRRRESQFRWLRQQIDDGALGRLVNAEANISRDRLGKVDLGSWRYTAAGMPGGVMLQIGIHYTDVLEYLMGPILAVSGRSVRLVLPGDNPDVASLILEHENGALSTLNASYASASEFYLMNIYGKDATVFYDQHGGMRMLRRSGDAATQIPFSRNDTFVEELEEFAAAARGEGTPEVDGEYATRSLAVVRAGILSAQQGRRVEVAEVLAEDGRAAERTATHAG